MKSTIVWVIVIVILLGGFLWVMNRPAVEVPPLQEEEQEMAQQPVVVALSTQNNSGISGTATLTDMNGSTLVKLDLVGAPVDVAEPAHIHTGSCANIGGVVYPLTDSLNGISETTLNVPLSAILSQLPLALNVHKSAEEVSVYVACGDLI